MPRIKLPNGQMVKFPEGLSDEQIEDQVQRLLDPRIAQAEADPLSTAAMQVDAGRVPGAPSQAQSMEDYQAGLPLRRAARLAGIVGTGANRGIANVAGLPVDAINNAPRLANLLPGVEGVPSIAENPLGGSQSIGDAFTSLLGETEADTSVERIIQRGAEEVGANLVPAGGLLNRARKGGQAVSKIGKTLDSFFTTPFRDAPGRALATETTLATGAGVGAGGAVELGKGTGIPPAVLDVLGALGGSLGTGGALRAGQLAKEVGKSALAPGETGRLVRDDVGRIIDQNTVDPNAFGTNFDRGAEIQEAIPGFKPDLPQATRDPALAALRDRRASGPNTAAFAEREAAQNQAVNAALDDTAPAVASDAATRAELTRRRDTAVGTAERATERADAGRETALEGVEPGQERIEAGRAIRGETETVQSDLKTKREEAALPALKEASASGAVVDTDPVRAELTRLQNTSKNTPLVRAAEEIERKLSKNQAGPEGELTPETGIEALQNVRREISRLIGQQGPNSLGQTAQKALIKVRDILTDQMTAGEPRFGEFLKKFSDESVPLNALENPKSATGKVLKENPLSKVPDLPDSQVPGQFFKKNSNAPDAIEEFTKRLGGRPNAVKALRDFALGDAQKAFDTGGAKGLERWIKSHTEALQYDPTISRDLGNLVAAEKTLARVTKREKLLKAGIDKPRQSTIARYLDPEEARESMEAILKAKNPKKEMTNLVRLVRGDPDALEGAKKAFYDLMIERNPLRKPGVIQSEKLDFSGTPFLNPKKFKSFLQENSDALEQLYKDSPEDLARIRKISEAVDRGLTDSGPRFGEKLENFLAKKNVSVPGLTVAGFTSRGYALARGVVSLPFVVGETALRAGRRGVLKVKRAEFEELLDRALLDPEVAKTLVMEYTRNNSKVINRRMRLHLGQEASTVIDDQAAEE